MSDRTTKQMIEELIEYEVHNMRISDLFKYARKGLQATLDKTPPSVVEWKYKDMKGENDV